MREERLSSLLMLHVHKDLTDSLDLIEVANSFVSDSEHRLRIFGKFALQSIRNNESYEFFWEKVLKCANSLDVDKAVAT